ncbi:energy-coupling factor transporter transmembrane protein EcfT [Collinsella sp. zg1085]|uniref:energy-coupling factor transporter transmembrane component T family protein n=1 Tax=Collinsella sp. zg1085 TaxID=2844380 RepID=UPI001C0D7048|nr:energy-coupling factor transporter transmembrane component T [Collinsella sp. zg1085]QWT17737.1 energy-coupling factor transporter transmembrane protein EcfT [Collinsella sp. zg1085]
MVIRTSLGKYFAGTSFIHKIDPRVKTLICILFMISCFMVQNLPALALCTLASLSACIASRVQIGLIARQLRPLCAFLLITSLFNLFFVQSGPRIFQLGILHLHLSGLTAAFMYTVRFLMLLLAGITFMLTTTPTAICNALERLLSPLARIGVPVQQLALMLSITLRFVPILVQEANIIRTAQISRGAQLEGLGVVGSIRASIPLLVPLFASAMRHAENLGRAMEVRAYGHSKTHSHYHDLRLSWRIDGLFIACFCGYICALAGCTLLL